MNRVHHPAGVHTLLLAGVLCMRPFTSAAAASATALVPCFVVWTFGWTESGHPKPWAFLLIAPSTAWILGLTGVLSATGLFGLTRLRQPNDPDT